MAIATKTAPNPAPQARPFEHIDQISEWFRAAIPRPTERYALTQLSVHFEEVSEMVQVLGAAGATSESCRQLIFTADALSYFQRQIKAGSVELVLNKINRVELLDALCNQIVTAVGVAHMFGMDIEGALKEVANSNDSKFEENGEPIFNAQTKIMKGPRYQPPELDQYAVRRVRTNV
jgi:predicted HAD superfamily Cof-like phosphohydrolase